MRTQEILCEVRYRKDRADAAGGGIAGYCLEDTKTDQGAEQQYRAPHPTALR